MSYGIIIARKAMANLRRLDFWLQEEVLDELEELAEDPPATAGARAYRMIRLRDDNVDVVYLRLLIDPAQATITLLDISTHPATP